MAGTTQLSAKQLSLLGRLSTLEALGGFYLAGGTAVGWFYGHRRSVDLDLFSVKERASLDGVVRALTSRAKAKVRAQTDVAIALSAQGVPVDLVNYPYPPLKKPLPGPEGFPIAAPVDLAVMKLAAIARRGLRRDFWDLYVLMHQAPMTMGAVLSAYRRRFKRTASDVYHLARALTFFGDAERDDPRVIGLSSREWGRIKGFFVEESSKLVIK